MSETSRTLWIFSSLTCATVESGPERDVNASECGKSWSWFGVAMGAGLAQGNISTSEPVWRGLDAVPWADCRLGTNELIGEDLLMIIRLGANQLMS